MKKLALVALLAVSLTACGGGTTYGDAVTQQMIDLAERACLPNGGLNILRAGTESERTNYRRWKSYEVVHFSCNNGLQGGMRTGRAQ